jgi:hypothetical protein
MLAAEADPDVTTLVHTQTGTTRRKSGFSFQSAWPRFVWQDRPGFATISSADQMQATVDWIAEGDTMVSIPKSHSVEESSGSIVHEHLPPTFSAIYRPIDSRRSSHADNYRIL